MDKKISIDELYGLINQLIENGRLLFKYYDNEKLELDIVAVIKDKDDNSVQVVFKNNFTEQLLKIREELAKKNKGLT